MRRPGAPVGWSPVALEPRGAEAPRSCQPAAGPVPQNCRGAVPCKQKGGLYVNDERRVHANEQGAMAAAMEEVRTRGAAGARSPRARSHGPAVPRSPRSPRSRRRGSRGCGTPPRTFVWRPRPTPSRCTRRGRCWPRGTWTAMCTCECPGAGEGGPPWDTLSGAPRPSAGPGEHSWCRQVLVLLHRGGEPAALVLGKSPQVVPGRGILPGRAE